MILGRDRERAAIEARLDEGGDRGGSVIAVRGIAGIGKTCLLEAIASRAAGTGMRVLAATGRETESDLPFAVLGELLGPVLDDVARLPQPQADALRAALTLAPGHPGDRYAVSVGALTLLAMTAEEAARGRADGPAGRPALLVVVDDLHWVDAPTRSVIAFIARRIERLPIVLLHAERPDTEPLGGGVPESPVSLGPLAPADAEALLDATAPDLAPSVRSLVLAAAGGVPLGLCGLPSALASEERNGRSMPSIPLRPGDAIRGAFEARIRRLDEAGRLALCAVAAAEPPEVAAIGRTLELLGLGTDTLDGAETDGLIQVTGARIAWTHPLARTVAYHATSAAARRRIHAALATVTSGEVRAWHLGRSVIGPDEAAAAALEEAGGGAAARRGFAAAASALERSAELTPPGERRAARLLAAGRAAGAAGDVTRATSLLDQALAATEDPLLRLDVEHQRCSMMLWAGNPLESARRLVAAAAPVAVDHPTRAGSMLADAAIALTAADIPSSLAVARQAETLVSRAPSAEVEAEAHVLAALAWCLTLSGRRQEAGAVNARLARLRASIAPGSPAMGTITLSAMNHLVVQDPRAAWLAIGELMAGLRAAGALLALAYPLAIAAYSAMWNGEWTAADAIAAEAAVLAEETGQSPTLAWALTAGARIDAARGRWERAGAAVERVATLSRRLGIASLEVYELSARAFLAICRGEAAAAALGTALARVRAVGVREPMMLPFCSDLVEGLLRAGDRAGAIEAEAWLEALASDAPGPWIEGIVARDRGLLGLDPPGDAFPAALAHHADMPFEQARSVLVQGEVLQRAGRRSDARAALRLAADGFEALGAAPWVARAEGALRTAGGGRPPGPGQRLSEAELRVARAVGRGLTNREAAAELFLSPRTVETHLEHIYTKLDLRTRAQLAALVAEGRLEDGEIRPAEP